MTKQEPMLMESPLTKHVFVVTSYKGNGDGTFTARQKHDVTAQFDALARHRGGTCRLEETESFPSERGMVHVLECSECGRECEHVNGDYEYCPHCLAKNELF